MACNNTHTSYHSADIIHENITNGSNHWILHEITVHDITLYENSRILSLLYCSKTVLLNGAYNMWNLLRVYSCKYSQGAFFHACDWFLLSVTCTDLRKSMPIIETVAGDARGVMALKDKLDIGTKLDPLSDGIVRRRLSYHYIYKIRVPNFGYVYMVLPILDAPGSLACTCTSCSWYKSTHTHL